MYYLKLGTDKSPPTKAPSTKAHPICDKSHPKKENKYRICQGYVFI